VEREGKGADPLKGSQRTGSRVEPHRRKRNNHREEPFPRADYPARDAQPRRNSGIGRSDPGRRTGGSNWPRKSPPSNGHDPLNQDHPNPPDKVSRSDRPALTGTSIRRAAHSRPFSSRLSPEDHDFVGSRPPVQTGEEPEEDVELKYEDIDSAEGPGDGEEYFS
jgi:hypothetical protein